jgi:hypothetical protein
MEAQVFSFLEPFTAEEVVVLGGRVTVLDRVEAV